MPTEGGVKPQSRDRTSVLVWVAILAAVALAARLYALDAKPLWLDEIFTKERAAFAVPALIEHSLQNNHSPLFFLIEHYIAYAMSGAIGLRLLPAFAGAFAAAWVFVIGRAAGLGAGAVLAGLLAALAPLQVAFGQEARPYTLLMALIAVALWGLVRLAADPARAAQSWPNGKGDRLAWLAYALGTAAALLTHADALLWLVVSNVAMLAVVFARTNARRAFFVRWCIVQGLIIVVAVPVYVAILSATKGQVLNSFLWIPPLTLQSVWTDVASLYGLRGATMVSLRLLPGPIPYLAPVTLALAAAGFVALHRQRAARNVLLIAAVGLPLCLALLSIVHPMLLPRYLLWSTVPFFVIAGAVIEGLPALARPLALAVATAVLVANLAPYYRAETKPRWDLAAAFLAGRLQQNDIVLIADSSAAVMLKSYLAERTPPVVLPRVTLQPAEAGLAFADSGRIWAVYGPAGQAKLPPISAFFAQAQALGVSGETARIGEEITIEAIHSAGGATVSEATSSTQRPLCRPDRAMRLSAKSILRRRC